MKAKGSAQLRAFVDAFLRAHANLVFSGSRGVGALLFVATVLEPRYAALGFSAVFSAYVASCWLKISTATPHWPYGYNALLVGLGIASAFAVDGASIFFAAALGALSVFATAALSSGLGRIAALPVLSWPFLLTASLSAGAVAYLPLSTPVPSLELWTSALPSWLALALQSFGAIVFLPRVLTGVVVFVALVWHSRIAATLAASAVAMTFAFASLAHVPLAHRLLLTSSFNAALAAIAVGVVWFVPSRSSFLLGLGSGVLSIFITLGLAGPLARLGLQLFVFPFNAAVLVVLFAMRQRMSDEHPYASDMLSATPEDTLLAFHARRVRVGTYWGVPIHLPFHGAWTCTQGVDGAFTHKNHLRYAFDFEVHAEPGGTLCLGAGDRLDDYHCFRLPILAAADGTVVAIENDFADSAVGEINDKQPWGNRVTIHHGYGLYSTVAHLARGTVAVLLGQVVHRGEFLGRCGSSGRSPRPHLHFQLQTGPTMFAATLPCRFASTVVRAPDGDRVAVDFEPREGLAVRSLEPDAALQSYFDFPLGQTFVVSAGRAREHLVCELDVWGRPSLRSREGRGAFAYRIAQDGFLAADISGSTRSALYLLRVALARVPFERGAVISWTDRVPRKWLMGRLRGALWDIASPFVDRQEIEIAYRRSIEGDRLVIAGASLEQRNGSPLVQTRVVLERGRLVSVEIVAHGRARRVEGVPSDRREFERDPESDGALPAAAPVFSRLGDSS